MTKIFKGTSNKPITELPSMLILDREISDDTFRLMCWISNQSDGFFYSLKNISKCLNYGRGKMQKILAEAEVRGYLARVLGRNKRGTLEWHYHVFVCKDECLEFKRLQLVDESSDRQAE